METPRDILLIDDHDDLREATADLLEALGYRVTAAARGADAADGRCFDVTGRFDVAVTSDAGAVPRLLDAGAGVVLLSSGPSAGDDRFGGRVRLLRKPFSPADLRDAVERAAVERAAAAPSVAPPAGQVPRKPRPAVLWGLAAAAVLVLASTVALQSARLGGPPLPEPVESTVRRGAALELVAPVGEVAAMPAAFDWRPVPGATSYRVRVLGVDGAPVWESAASGGELAMATGLHHGVVYAWEVEALDADGRTLAASATARFRVTPGAVARGAGRSE